MSRKRRRSKRQRKRWVTIVGPDTEVPSDDPQLRGRWLERGEQPQFRGYATEAMQRLLMFERGIGPERPDDKPEPTTTTK